MVEQMREREAEIARLRAEERALQGQLAALRDDCRRREAETSELREELRSIVDTRNDVSALRSLLQSMQDGGGGGGPGSGNSTAAAENAAADAYYRGLEAPGEGGADSWGPEEGLANLLTHHVGQSGRPIAAGAPRWYVAG